MNKYEEILALADVHFQTVAGEQPQNLQCGVGCSFCCHGLFEIGRADAEVIADGLRSMPAARRARIIARAEKIAAETAHPNIREITPEEKEAFFDRTDGVPCPALNRLGECTMYAHRPIVCRTFGLPIREGSDYIGDICELNFTTASQEEKERAVWDILAENPGCRGAIHDRRGRVNCCANFEC